MYWFKHDCGAIKDEEIQYAIEKYGGNGYMLFFGLIELVGEKMDAKKHPEPEAEFRWTFLRGKFHISRTKVEQFLKDCSERLNFTYEVSEENLKIRFPNLLKRLDEAYEKSRQRRDKVPTVSGKSPDGVGYKKSDEDLRLKIKVKDDSDSFLNSSQSQKPKIAFTAPELHDNSPPELLTEEEENKLREYLRKFFDVRGWNGLKKLEDQVFGEVLKRVEKRDPRLLIPYFMKSLTNFINENAEWISGEVKKQRE